MVAIASALLVLTCQATTQYFSGGASSPTGTNTICATLGSNRGILGTDNKLRVSTTNQAYDSSSGQLISTNIEWTFSPPYVDYFPLYIGEIPDRMETVSVPTFMPRLDTSSARSDIFRSAIEYILTIARTRFNTTAAATPQTLAEAEIAANQAEEKALGFLSRTLQETSNTGAATAGDQGEDVLAPLASDVQSGIAANVSNIRTSARTFIDNSKTTQANLVAQTTQLISQARTVLQNFTVINQFSNDIFSDTVKDFSKYNDSSQFVIDSMTSALVDSRNMLAMQQQALDESYAQLNGSVVDLAVAIGATTDEVSNMTAPIDAIYQVAAQQLAIGKAHLTVIHEELENLCNGLRYKSSLIKEQDADPMRAAINADIYDVQTRMVQLSGGAFQPAESVLNPPLQPLGFVPLHPGDDRFYYRATYVHSFIADPNAPGGPYADDTMMELVLASNAETPTPQDSQRLTQYETIVGASPVYITDLKRVYAYCSPDFAVDTQTQWNTAANLVNFTGPIGCTPFVNCSCWFAISRERCSTYVPVSSILGTLAGSGQCRDQSELVKWYRQDNVLTDTSITRFAAFENVTNYEQLLSELNRSCRQAGTDFVFDSSVTTPDDGVSFASPLSITVVNDVTQCVANPLDVERRPTSTTPTLPFQFFQGMKVAVNVLYNRVLGQWTAEKEGTTPVTTTFERGSFFPFAQVYRRPDPASRTPWSQRGSPPLLAEYSIATRVFWGKTSLPLSVLLQDPQGYRQDVTVTMTNALGVRTQKIYNAVRSNLIPNKLDRKIFVAGYRDCIKTPCLNPYSQTASNTDPEFTLSLYDTPPGTLSGSRSEALRHHKPDAALLFTDPTVYYQDGPGIQPYAAPGHYTEPLAQFSVDDYMAQATIERLRPEFMTDGIQRYWKRVVKNATTGTFRVVAKSGQSERDRHANLGQLGLALETHTLLSPTTATLLSPGLDSSRAVRFAVNEFEGEFCFETDGTELGVVSRDDALCPNPDQIALAPVSSSTPLQLTIANGRSVALNLTLVIAPVSSDPEQVARCTKTVGNITIPALLPRTIEVVTEYRTVNTTFAGSANGVVQSSEFLCPVLRLQLFVVQPGSGAVLAPCWDYTANQTALSQQTTFIRDSLSRQLDDTRRLASTQDVLDANTMDSAGFITWGVAQSALVHLQTLDNLASIMHAHYSYQEQADPLQPGAIWNATMSQQSQAALDAGKTAAAALQLLLATNAANDRAANQGRLQRQSEADARVDASLDQVDRFRAALHDLDETIQSGQAAHLNLTETAANNLEVASAATDRALQITQDIDAGLRSTLGIATAFDGSDLATAPSSSDPFDLNTVRGGFWRVADALSTGVKGLQTAGQFIGDKAKQLVNLAEKAWDFLQKLWDLLPIIITVIVVLAMTCGGVYLLSKFAGTYRALRGPGKQSVTVHVDNSATAAPAAASPDGKIE